MSCKVVWWLEFARPHSLYKKGEARKMYSNCIFFFSFSSNCTSSHHSYWCTESPGNGIMKYLFPWYYDWFLFHFQFISAIMWSTGFTTTQNISIRPTASVHILWHATFMSAFYIWMISDKYSDHHRHWQGVRLILRALHWQGPSGSILILSSMFREAQNHFRS